MLSPEPGENDAGRFGRRIAQRGNAHAAVALHVIVVAVGQAEQDIVAAQLGGPVLLDDLDLSVFGDGQVPGVRLEGDVVEEVELRVAGDETAHGRNCAARRGRVGLVGQAHDLAVDRRRFLPHCHRRSTSGPCRSSRPAPRRLKARSDRCPCPPADSSRSASSPFARCGGRYCRWRRLIAASSIGAQRPWPISVPCPLSPLEPTFRPKSCPDDEGRRARER